MKMKDGLPSVRPRIRHEPESGLSDPFLVRDFCAGLEEVPEQGGVLRLQVLQRPHMPPGNHQDMDRGLGMHILERHREVVFIHGLGRDGPCHDPAEDAVTHSRTFPFSDRRPGFPNRAASSW